MGKAVSGESSEEGIRISFTYTAQTVTLRLRNLTTWQMLIGGGFWQLVLARLSTGICLTLTDKYFFQNKIKTQR